MAFSQYLNSKDESKYSHGTTPPICALPRHEMNEGSNRKISEEVRTKNLNWLGMYC